MVAPRLVFLVTILSGVVVGCGTSERVEESRVQAKLAVRSMAVTKGRYFARIPARYRCKEKEIWLPVEWKGVPGGTAEVVLAITARSIKREGRALSSTLLTEWIVGGLPPYDGAVVPGKLPSEAFITGHNVSTLDCPRESQETAFVFAVYALPFGRPLHSFEAIGQSTIEALEDRALGSGYILALYGGNGRS